MTTEADKLAEELRLAKQWLPPSLVESANKAIAAYAASQRKGEQKKKGKTKITAEEVASYQKAIDECYGPEPKDQAKRDSQLASFDPGQDEPG